MVYRSIRTKGRHMPGGSHAVLWLQGHYASLAITDATVTAAFDTLVGHHEWDEAAKESL